MKKGINKIDTTILPMLFIVILAFAFYGQLSPVTIAPGITNYENTSQIDGVLRAASGTFTFSGNVSNGELANITNGAAVYRFEFNTSGNPNLATVLTANAIRVNVSDIGSWNDSIRASGNLTAAINANASTAAILTAANTTNLTTLTADTAGTSGNSITLADNAANIASSGLAGGSASGYSTWDASTQTTYTASGGNMSLVWFIIPFAIIAIFLREFS